VASKYENLSKLFVDLSKKIDIEELAKAAHEPVDIFQKLPLGCPKRGH